MTALVSSCSASLTGPNEGCPYIDSLWRCVIAKRVLSRVLISWLPIAVLTACGGGGGDSAGGGGTAGPPGAPPLPAVNYQGRTSPATVSEQDAYFLADALDSAVVWTIALGEVADPFLFQGLGARNFDENLISPDGGSARQRGASTVQETGWLELDYSAWRDGDTIFDGRMVIEVLTPPNSSGTLRARASFQGLRVREVDSFDRTVTGTLTREAVGLDLDLADQRSTYAGRFLLSDESAGWTRLIGPIELQDRAYAPQFTLGEARELRISGEVSLADLGRLQIPDSGAMAYQRQQGFGIGWKFRGSLTGVGAGSAAVRLTGLTRDWGALELDTDGSRRFPRSSAVRWPGGLTLARRPDAGGLPVALAGPRRLVRAGEATPIEGRFAEHTAGRFVTQSWEIVLQPPDGDAQLQQVESTTPVFTAGRYGSYLLRQRVSDGTNTHDDYVEVVVTEVQDELDARPYAGPDLQVPLAGRARLDLARSTRFPGHRPMFLWPQISDGLAQLDSTREPIFFVDMPTRRGSVLIEVSDTSPGPRSDTSFFNAWDAMQIHQDVPAAFMPLGYFSDNGISLDEVYDLALEDLTGDGLPDLVMSGRFGGSDTAVLRVYPGLGPGRFGPPVDTVAAETGWIAIADLDGDATPEVLLRSRAGIQIFEVAVGGSLTPGTFLPRSTECELMEIAGPFGLSTGQAHAVDVNGDGRLDIVHSYGCLDGYIEVFLQAADGSWMSPVASTFWPAAGSPGPLAFADIDGNGRTEVAFPVQTEVAPFYGVYLGRGQVDGSFEFEPLHTGRSAPPLLVDLDGDGRVDLVLSDEARVLIRHGTDDGTFSDAVVIPQLEDVPIFRLHALPLTTGSLPAILVGRQGGFELVEQRAPRLYEAAGHTVPTYNIRAPGAMRLVTTDLTGDGRTDLLIASGGRAGITVQRPLPRLESTGSSAQSSAMVRFALAEEAPPALQRPVPRGLRFGLALVSPDT